MTDTYELDPFLGPFKSYLSFFSPESPNPDERPIVATRKSFEELLEEKLGVHEGEGSTSVSQQLENQSPAFVKRKNISEQQREKSRSFLKKGSGLVRYGGVGSPPKMFKRSKSQNSVKNHTPPSRMMSSKSCSRLNNVATRETIAFASKKTPPKRSKSLSSSTSLATNKTNVGGKTSSGKSQLLRNATSRQPAKMACITSDNRAHRDEINGDDDEASVSVVHDSVELSFREKLKAADQKHKVATLTSLTVRSRASFIFFDGYRKSLRIWLPSRCSRRLRATRLSARRPPK